jgi:hypothetical protein
MDGVCWFDSGKAYCFLTHQHKEIEMSSTDGLEKQLEKEKPPVVIVSVVCRVAIPPKLFEWAAEQPVGVTQIPEELLGPRQVRINANALGIVPAVLKWHRDAYIPTLKPRTAADLVDNGLAEYLPQSLLTYSREDYLKDNDVQANVEEFTRVSRSDAEKVIVAVVGESRSPLAVCRNIVSGCQKEETLVEDAEGAVNAACVFLIEY